MIVHGKPDVDTPSTSIIHSAKMVSEVEAGVTFMGETALTTQQVHIPS